MSFNVVDFLSGGANIAVAGASASATLPANNTGASQTYAVAATTNTHFRIGKGAQTAVVTDPMFVTNLGLMYVNVPAGSDTIAAIQDTAAGTLNVFRVMEG